MLKRKLAVVSTHPIQYYSPVFRALAASPLIELRVFYTWSQAADRKLPDVGFAATLEWDIPLQEGYPHQFVPNVAKGIGPEQFRGIKNPSLIAEIETWGPDALLVYGWCHQSHLQALRYFKGRIPVFFRGDSTLLDQRKWWRKAMRRAFLWWLYRHVDVALAVGSNSVDYFEWCGIPRSRIVIAPHSVDTIRFGEGSPGAGARADAWRQELGIPSDAVVFLYAGKFQRKKAPEMLIDAFTTLTGRSHLVLVGSGELDHELRARTTGRNTVHFLPFQNQSVMPTVYRVADVFVLPSRGPGETWGLALNEAMASGRAIIASSNVGGARDLIQHGENGWIFESENQAALAVLLQVASAQGRGGLQRMGDVGRQRSASWSTEESARITAQAVVGRFDVHDHS